MEKIYSRVVPSKLLHIVFRVDETPEDRQELISADNFLQCCVIRMNEGRTFRPHEHIYKDVTYTEMKSQQSMVVVRGSIVYVFYDIDGTELCRRTLNLGDIGITLHGGHTFVGLEEGSIVYEHKVGPYLGPEKDKIFID